MSCRRILPLSLKRPLCSDDRLNFNIRVVFSPTRQVCATHPGPNRRNGQDVPWPAQGRGGLRRAGFEHQRLPGHKSKGRRGNWGSGHCRGTLNDAAAQLFRVVSKCRTHFQVFRVSTRPFSLAINSPLQSGGNTAAPVTSCATRAFVVALVCCYAAARGNTPYVKILLTICSSLWTWMMGPPPPAQGEPKRPDAPRAGRDSPVIRAQREEQAVGWYVRTRGIPSFAEAQQYTNILAKAPGVHGEPTGAAATV